MGIILRPSGPEDCESGRARYRVDVTQADVDAGVPCNSVACPVAFALRRTLSAWCVAVQGDGTWVALNPDFAAPPLCGGKLPSDVETRVNRFDRTGKMEPFSFEVEV